MDDAIEAMVCHYGFTDENQVRKVAEDLLRNNARKEYREALMRPHREAVMRQLAGRKVEQLLMTVENNLRQDYGRLFFENGGEYNYTDILDKLGFNRETLAGKPHKEIDKKRKKDESEEIPYGWEVAEPPCHEYYWKKKLPV